MNHAINAFFESLSPYHRDDGCVLPGTYLDLERVFIHVIRVLIF